LISESWRRCAEFGVDPAQPEAPLKLDDAALTQARLGSDLQWAMPVIRSLLTDAAAEAGHVVAVADADGLLLWVEGAHDLRKRAESMGFAAGACWSEREVGTNAPGTALALDLPVQVFATEHYLDAVAPWSCTAVPIHDPHGGSLLGVLDLTGNHSVTGAQSLALVRATVMAVESALRDAGLPAHGPRTATSTDSATAAMWRLELLGRESGELRRGDRTTHLSLRHTEILLLLAMHPHGLSGERLAILLDDRDISPVTVRAEMTRLRRQLGPTAVASRPYRLTRPLVIDALEVHSALRHKDTTEALRGYQGPLLTRSEAPAILQLRSEIDALVGSAAARTNDLDALRRYLDTEQGRMDWSAHRRLLDLLGADAPERALVAARLNSPSLVG